MNTLVEPPVKSNRVDWLQAKMLYTEDRTKSYADIARMFGVSLKQVKKYGAREQWLEGRREVSVSVENKIKETLVDEQVATNERHRRAYKNMQALANTYMSVIAHHNKSVIEQARADSRIVNPNDLFATHKLLALFKSMKMAIEGERVTASLPTAIKPAPATWRPSDSSNTEESPELKTLYDELAACGINLREEL